MHQTTYEFHSSNSPHASAENHLEKVYKSFVTTSQPLTHEVTYELNTDLVNHVKKFETRARSGSPEVIEKTAHESYAIPVNVVHHSPPAVVHHSPEAVVLDRHKIDDLLKSQSLDHRVVYETHSVPTAVIHHSNTIDHARLGMDLGKKVDIHERYTAQPHVGEIFDSTHHVPINTHTRYSAGDTLHHSSYIEPHHNITIHHDPLAIPKAHNHDEVEAVIRSVKDFEKTKKSAVPIHHDYTAVRTIGHTDYRTMNDDHHVIERVKKSLPPMQHHERVVRSAAPIQHVEEVHHEPVYHFDDHDDYLLEMMAYENEYLKQHSPSVKSSVKILTSNRPTGPQTQSQTQKSPRHQDVVVVHHDDDEEHLDEWTKKQLLKPVPNYDDETEETKLDYCGLCVSKKSKKKY